jgi:hypothetical protein
MSFPIRRSIKMLTGSGRNFGRRDWTSIGLRGMPITGKAAGSRAKVGLPGNGLSYAHREESRSIGLREAAPDPSPNARARPKKDWRGLFWIALIIFAIAAAAVQAIK